MAPGFPENNHLLEVSQSWGEDSEFGSLQEKNLQEGDLEFRIWAGFGVRGDRGIILNRTKGNWKAYTIEIRTCEVLSHKEGVSDSLKSLVTIDKEFTNQIDCDLERAESGETFNEIPQFTDSLFFTELQSEASFKTLWKKLKNEGVLKLPTKVERSYGYTDGHSYVVEIKIGESYRAFVSGNVPEHESDVRIQKVAEIIDSYLHTSIDGRKW
ncbi:MAG: hypothetical protein CL667_09565 [Balneola sp.]|nr:hypothetical protein [Balneola sp.]HAD49930.1 hypothetical protein [Algoriphagus sp.]